MTKLLAKKNLSDQVVALIGDRIVKDIYAETGVLPPEEELRTELSVSRTAVREAIKMLSSKGVVESRPKTGTRILPRDQWNFLDSDVLDWSITSEPEGVATDFLALRRSVEPDACATAATKATGEQRLLIKDAFQKMESVDKNWSHIAWVVADSYFHQLIYLASNNIFYISIGRLLSQALKTSLEIASSDESTCIDQHRKLMNAILEGDSEAARRHCIELLSGDKLGKKNKKKK